MKLNLTYLIYLVGLLVFSTDTIAQNDSAKKRMCDPLMQSSNIFEGKVISVRNYRIKRAEGYSSVYKAIGTTYDNFNSYKILVRKVIKGTIQIGTIEVIDAGYGVVFQNADNTIYKNRPADKMDIPMDTALFFCLDANPTSIQKDSITYTNSKSLRFYDAYSISGNKLVKSSMYGLPSLFATLSEFYGYLSTNYQIKIGTSFRDK